MNINGRIRLLRKEKGWTQKNLAALLGITQSGVSFMEQDGSTVSDQTIKTLCLACPGLSETWLRTGEGEMYSSEELFSLDRFAAEHGASELELAIVKAYFELDPAIRRVVLEHFASRLSTPAIDPDELEAERIKQEYLREKKAAAGSSATASAAGEKGAG